MRRFSSGYAFIWAATPSHTVIIACTFTAWDWSSSSTEGIIEFLRRHVANVPGPGWTSCICVRRRGVYGNSSTAS